MPSAFTIVRRLLEADGDEPEDIQRQLQQPELGLAGGEDDIDAYLLDPARAAERYLKTKPAVKGHDHHGLFNEWKRKWFESGRPRRDGNELRRKLEPNTWAIYTEGYRPEDSTIAVRLHNTDILKVLADDTLVANMGGWNTVTTRDRMNRYLPGAWGVYTLSGSAYWYNHGIPSIHGETSTFRIPFRSGDKILPDGTLEYQDEHEYVKRRKKRPRAPRAPRYNHWANYQQHPPEPPAEPLEEPPEEPPAVPGA